MMFFETIWHGSYELSITVKLLLAALAGGIIGFEREIHGRPAGLRTHLLVTVGSCLMMIISEAFHLKYGDLGVESAVRLDPSRTAAQIIAGIGFLGAGVILKEGVNVRGLTTAASLWVVAGLGMAFGMGLFGPAVITTLLAFFSLFFLKKLEPVIKKDRYLFLTVVAGNDKDIYPELERIFRENNLRVSDVSASLDLGIGEVGYDFILTQHRRRMGRELTTVIAGLPGVKKVSFK
jgi:putative Mg2+ transporter-C (MgtC) family protein